MQHGQGSGALAATPARDAQQQLSVLVAHCVIDGRARKHERLPLGVTHVYRHFAADVAGAKLVCFCVRGDCGVVVAPLAVLDLEGDALGRVAAQ